MKELIGNSLLSKLKPSSKEYDVWDTKLKGFILRVLPSGSRVYRCEYGRGKRITLGKTTVMTPTQARDKAKQILGHAAIGTLRANKKTQKMTLKNFINSEYEAWRIATRKNGKDDIKRLKVNFINEFGDILLQDISPMLIENGEQQELTMVFNMPQ